MVDRRQPKNRNSSINKINQQPSSSSGSRNYDPNRYRLHFQSDTNEEVEQGKALAREPIDILTETACEIDLDTIYEPGSALDMPKRPAWDYSMTRQALENREEKYFKEYLDKIAIDYGGRLTSYFELNLETWRQLWRVLEMADVILLITDIRHPALHFSPALYNYVVHEQQKHLILVLNKIDLAPPALVVAWKHYFQSRFPELSIVCFTSMPKDEKERNLINKDPTAIQKRRKRRKYSALGPKQLLQACEKIVKNEVDLTSWRCKIEEDAKWGEEELEESDDEGGDEQASIEPADGSFIQHKRYLEGVLTIGCCGYPNVGKSSVINGLVGKKVVSVSRTPGHTKHFQTIFLTPTVKLCDSPGLVFPSLVCRPLQVLAGIFPISQLRQPYTSVKYLAERLNLPALLKLKHPEMKQDEEDGVGLQGMKSDVADRKYEWSAYHIVDAWADKRGFLTAKAGRNDVYRAANHILRLASEGRICLCMKPPGFTANRDKWESNTEAAEILQLQEIHKGVSVFTDDLEIIDEDYENDVDDEENSNDDNNSVSTNPFALLSDE